MRHTSNCRRTPLPGTLRAPVARFALALLGVLLSAFTVCAQARKTISRAELEDVLSHSITVVLLNDYCKTPDGFYPGTGTRIVHPEEMTPPGPDHSPLGNLLKEDRISGRSIARYADMLRLIGRLRPRMVTDAVSQWGAWDWPIHLNRCRATVADIKSIDPDIIVQASVNEYMDRSTAGSAGTIPPWVWEAFGLPDEHRRFDIYKMMFRDWFLQGTGEIRQRWWVSAGLKDGLPDAVVPDISTLEAQMWFYYQGRMFMDMGCESLSFSQVELMNNNSHDPTHWNIVFEKLRAYADTKPALRYLLITGATNSMRDAEGNLPFDFHICPVRPSELETNMDVNGGDCEITATSCKWREGPGKIYGRSVGGRTPSGWWCDALPGQVLIDNWGQEGPSSKWGTPVKGDGGCDLYHLDEITWFALQDKAYRDHWLRYAYHRVHELDPNIYLALPVKRRTTYRDDWYPADYLANNPRPGLFDPPATIGHVPGGDVDRARVQLYAGYGQEDVIQELLLAGPSTALSALRVVPNPAAGWIRISLTQPGAGSLVKYALVNAMGAQAAAGEFRGMTHRIDVSALSRGFYVLTVWDGSERHTAKVSLH